MVLGEARVRIVDNFCKIITWVHDFNENKKQISLDYINVNLQSLCKVVRLYCHLNVTKLLTSSKTCIKHSSNCAKCSYRCHRCPHNRCHVHMDNRPCKPSR